MFDADLSVTPSAPTHHWQTWMIYRQSPPSACSAVKLRAGPSTVAWMVWFDRLDWLFHPLGNPSLLPPCATSTTLEFHGIPLFASKTSFSHRNTTLTNRTHLAQTENRHDGIFTPEPLFQGPHPTAANTRSANAATAPGPIFDEL